MNKRTLALAGLMALAAASRLLQHINIAPITAIAVFAGIRFSNRHTAAIVPLAALLCTDLLKEVLHYYGLAVHPGIYGGMWSVYATTALVALMSRVAYDSRSPAVIGATTLAGSVVFFLVTNFAEWTRGVLYPLTAEGLATCYTMAIPFFRNSLLGDMVFSGVLFGAWAFAEARFPVLRQEPKMATA